MTQPMPIAIQSAVSRAVPTCDSQKNAGDMNNSAAVIIGGTELARRYPIELPVSVATIMPRPIPRK